MTYDYDIYYEENGYDILATLSNLLTLFHIKKELGDNANISDRLIRYYSESCYEDSEAVFIISTISIILDLNEEEERNVKYLYHYGKSEVEADFPSINLSKFYGEDEDGEEKTFFILIFPPLKYEQRIKEVVTATQNAVYYAEKMGFSLIFDIEDIYFTQMPEIFDILIKIRKEFLLMEVQ